MGSRKKACICYWEAVQSINGTYAVSSWALQMQVDEGRWFVHEQLEDSVKWKMKEVLGLKKVEGVFDSNQCVRSGKSSARILTTPKSLADELRLKFEDQKTRRTSRDGNVSVLAGRKSRDGNVSSPRHGASGDWYTQEWTFLMCNNMANEVRMKKMNLVPIMVLQSSATVTN